MAGGVPRAAECVRVEGERLVGELYRPLAKAV